MTDDLISRAAAIAAMAPMLRSMISRGYAVEAIRALPAVDDSQPDPRDAVIARLVEAIENADGYDRDCGCDICMEVDLAIAAAKGGAS